ncbi:MAG: SusC/RagA family protein, partial [Pedobacter sp.]
MKKLLQSLFILMFVAGTALAQNRTVSGTVTDSQDGKPLPGVTVRVKGTTNGTTTSANGQYSLSISTGATSLEFSYVGFTPLTKTVGTSNTLNAALVSDANDLSEVVVLGYGTVNKKDNTASVSKVTGSQVTDQSIPSFDRALAGKATGVQVITPSGLLGQAPQIRIRGINSISSGTTPLFVIDGIPSISGNVGGFTSANALADINPNDIESI